MFRGHNPVNTDPRKNALLLAQLHTNYYHLLKFGHYPFIGGEEGVAHTRFSFVRTNVGKSICPTLCVGGINM